MNGKPQARLAATISIAAFALAAASAATAAEQTADDGAGIQEIVVTAQKRQQSGQDVGIALSVVSADALAQRNVTSVTDLTGLVPNVQANFGAGQVRSTCAASAPTSSPPISTRRSRSMSTKSICRRIS